MNDLVIICITIIVSQLIVYGVSWLIMYDNAVSGWGSSKKDFKDFLQNYKWWKCLIPFYSVYIGFKWSFEWVTNINKNVNNILNEGEREVKPRLRPPSILDRHREVQKTLDDMLEEKVRGKSLSEIIEATKTKNKTD